MTTDAYGRPSAYVRLPQRTCVACRSTSGKRGARARRAHAGGRVEVDPTGKKPGRGAYLCHQPECWQTATRRRARLERARSKTAARRRDDKLRLTDIRRCA